MADIYFINATYIKEFTFVDENVDEKYLLVSIKEAQEIHIREYIGSGLYDELVSQIDNNNLTALNTTLLDTYIIPSLKWWVIYEAAPFLTFKFTNKNIVTKNSDNSTTIGANDLDRLMEFVKHKAQYHTRRLINYLLEYESSYPLYTNPGDQIDTIFPNLDSFSSAIYLEDDNRLYRRDSQFMNQRNNERYKTRS